MRSPRFSLSLLPAMVALSAATGCKRDPSPDELRAALVAHPEVLYAVIRAHPDSFVAVLSAAAQQAQGKMQAREEQDARARIDDGFRHPQTAQLAHRVALGNPAAPVTIVEYTDFQCPYCRRERDVLVEVMKRYGDRVRLVVKHTPLEIHPQARPAALLYEAIARRDPTAAFRFYDDLYEHQEQLAAGGARFLDAAARRALRDDAAAEGAIRDARGDSVAAVVAADEAEGRRLGFTGTPGFLINGVAIQGAYPLSTFQEIIDRHLEERGRDAASAPSVTASSCTATTCPRPAAH